MLLLNIFGSIIIVFVLILGYLIINLIIKRKNNNCINCSNKYCEKKNNERENNE